MTFIVHMFLSRFKDVVVLLVPCVSWYNASSSGNRARKLIPWNSNPRLNEYAVDAVAESIRSFGFNVPLLCDQNSIIIVGHTRWKAAQKLSLDKVSVILVEMTDAERQAFAIADNKNWLQGWPTRRWSSRVAHVPF